MIFFNSVFLINIAQPPTILSGFVDLHMPIDLNMLDADAVIIDQQDQLANVNSANL